MRWTEPLALVVNRTRSARLPVLVRTASTWAAGGHLLIRYIVDRRDNEIRWVQALEKTDVPLNFVCGMRDPISGAHMAERIRERVPHAPLEALHDVGHWPPLEAPDRTVSAIQAH